MPIPIILNRAYSIFVTRGNLPSPPKKLNAPKITMERQNAIFVRCSEFLAQTNSKVNIGASNAPITKKANDNSEDYKTPFYKFTFYCVEDI